MPHVTIRVYRADGETIGAVEWGHKKETWVENGVTRQWVTVVSDGWPYTEDEMIALQSLDRSIVTYFDPGDPNYFRA